MSPADALLSGSTSDFAPAILSAATKFGVRIITLTIPGALQRFDARSRIHMALFAGTLTVALYIVTDMEYPRLGLVRIEAFDHFLADAYGKMQ